MQEQERVVVLKFGSSVLRDESDLALAAHEIQRWRLDHWHVIAVVSAFGNTTDELLRRAESVCAKPERSALAALLATGETVSSAMLALALNYLGVPARLLDPVQAGLRTVGARLEADLIAVNVARLRAELGRGVVILPGFVGRGEDGDTTLLGRGGSDFSALVLAHHLRASCVLFKDVDGIYPTDPANSNVSLSPYAELSYETAALVGREVVQLKAVRFAAAHRLRFLVTSVSVGKGTEVGPVPDRAHPEPSDPAFTVSVAANSRLPDDLERMAEAADA